MKYIILLLLLTSPLQAQYWVGFENDGAEDVTSFSIWDGGVDLTGNLLAAPLPPSGTYTYPSLSAGTYTLAAQTQHAVHTMPITVPPGVVGGVTVRLSQFPYVLGVPPTQPASPRPHDPFDTEEGGGCVARGQASVLSMLLLLIAGLSARLVSICTRLDCRT